jgi:Rap1a immunity proteins
VKRLLCWIIVYVAALGFNIPAGAEEPLTRTVQDLYSDCKSESAVREISCMRFLQGAGEIMMTASIAVADKDLPIVVRRTFRTIALCTNAITGGQLKQAFINWAEKNPKDWQLTEEEGAQSALTETWRCPYPQQ